MIFYVIGAIVLLVAATWALKEVAEHEPQGRLERILGCGVLVLPFAAAIVLSSYALHQPPPGRCTTTASVSPRTAPTDRSTLTDTLRIRDVASTKISLGSSPGPANAGIILEIEPQDSALVRKSIEQSKDVAVGTDFLRRGDNPDVSVAVSTHAAFTSPTTVTVYVCIERASFAPTAEVGTLSDNAATHSTATTMALRSSTPATEGAPQQAAETFTLDPGEYSGSVTITDPRLPTTTIPFTLTLSHQNWALVLMAWCMTVFVGSLYVAVIRKDPSMPAQNRAEHEKSAQEEAVQDKAAKAAREAAPAQDVLAQNNAAQDAAAQVASAQAKGKGLDEAAQAAAAEGAAARVAASQAAAEKDQAAETAAVRIARLRAGPNGAAQDRAAELARQRLADSRAVARDAAAAQAPIGSDINLDSLVTFLGSWLGLASVVTGGAAALGIYASLYLGSPSWGVSTSEWLGLIGAMFGAFVTAGTAFRFAAVLNPSK